MQINRKITIKQLDMSLILPNNVRDVKHGGHKIVIIGKPGEGKSILIDDILYQKRHIFPTGLACSGTEDSNKNYANRFPDCFIYNALNEEIVQSFINRQVVSRDHLSVPWAVLVLDDVMTDPNMFNNQVFYDLFKNGRHYALLCILALQYGMDIKPGIRDVLDGVFIFRNPLLRSRKKIYENFASIIPSFDLFCKIMDTVTNDHTALYIHNSSTSNNIEDCVFWYKAKRVPSDFKVGCKEFWDFDRVRNKNSQSSSADRPHR